MNKMFTVNGASGSVSVEAATRVEAIEKTKHKVTDLYSVKGPRFTDSLRSKPPRKVDTDTVGKIHYLGTRAAVRALARF